MPPGRPWATSPFRKLTCYSEPRLPRHPLSSCTPRYFLYAFLLQYLSYKLLPFPAPGTPRQIHVAYWPLTFLSPPHTPRPWRQILKAWRCDLVCFFPIVFSAAQQIPCCIRKSAMKHVQKSDWKSDFSLLVMVVRIGSACLCGF